MDGNVQGHSSLAYNYVKFENLEVLQVFSSFKYKS
jgi:hypothetical protein